jgi:hypothetical protein
MSVHMHSDGNQPVKFPDQLDWLSAPPPIVAGSARPRARSTDPSTSHEAAEAMVASGAIGRQAAEVLAAVQRWPGLTSLELGARMEIDRWAVARRLPELEPAHVRRGEPRTINGRRHVTWWPR